MDEMSFFENIICSISGSYKKNKIPFISAMIAGVISYGFAFANKLVQQDDLAAFFGKGTSLTAGRWGLEIMSLIFPDLSMPWLYGILSVILLSVAVCAVINAASLKNRVSQAIFAAVVMASAAVLGIFTQPYLSSSNALAILLSAIAVAWFESGEKRKVIAGIVLLAFSMSIYQAYISFAASVLVVFLIRDLVNTGEDAGAVFKRALKYVAFLALAVALYGILTFAVNKIFDVQVLSYAVSDYGILMRIRVAYTAFAGYFIKGYFSFVNSDVSLFAHAAIAALSLYAFISGLKGKKVKDILLAVLLILILPLAVNSFYLVASVNVFSAIVFMSFNALYLLAFLLFDNRLKNLRGIMMLFASVILICNVYFSNEISLKMYMQTSQMKAFCQSIMSAVYASGEYEDGDVIAIIGEENDESYIFDRIDSTNYIGLTAKDVYNIYTRDRFLELYLGYSGPFASFDKKAYISRMPEFAEMGCFPNSDGIKNIDGVVVVKLG